jgi:hypothetical protein
VRIADRFDLSAPPERVWSVLNDIELISPFVPGFTLKHIDGDVFRGAMRVKLGAMTVEYDTEIVIAERDDVTRMVRMDVAGREPRGGGRMRAAVTSQLEPVGAGTKVTLDTELELVGRVAQMGRGMIADVSALLIREFVGSLEANVLDARPSNDGERVSTAEPVDLTRAASRAAAKRVVPALLAGLALLWLLRRAVTAR